MKPVKKITPTSKDQAIKEAYRYLGNAKETLSKSPIEYGAYSDSKYVREAAGIAYLSALQAIDGYLIGKGFKQDELPDSIEEYRMLMQKHTPNPQMGDKGGNGKLMAALRIVYENLHMFAYYRGATGVELVKEGFTNCKKIIDMLAKTK